MSPIAETIADDISMAIGQASSGNRNEMLARLAGHFLRIASTLDPVEIEMFDQVFLTFMHTTGVEARSSLASVLAPMAVVPAATIDLLALDEALEVAAPILRDCAHVKPETLLVVARDRGDGFLEVIAGRPDLDEAITDVIVDRGSDVVLVVLGRNGAARFSAAGGNAFAMRAHGVPALREILLNRPDFVPHARAIMTGEADNRDAVEGSGRIGRFALPDVALAPREGEAIPAGTHDGVPIGAGLNGRVASALDASALDHALALVAVETKLGPQFVMRAFAASPLGTFLLILRASALTWNIAERLLLRRLGAGFDPFKRRQAEVDFRRVSSEQALRVVHTLEANTPASRH